MLTAEEFLRDATGRRYGDVVNDIPDVFAAALEVLADPATQRRMEEAEELHERPALSGAVAALEARPEIDAYFRSTDAHRTQRFRQAVGVAVRMVMQARGWRTTGVKGSLGRRKRVAPGTTAPGAYYNISGTSRWFTRAERYRRQATDATPTPPRSGEAATRGAADAADVARALAGLDRVAALGSPEEQRASLEDVMSALAATRASEGRVF